MKRYKRVLNLLLAFAVTLSMLPSAAYAQSETEEPVTVSLSEPQIYEDGIIYPSYETRRIRLLGASGSGDIPSRWNSQEKGYMTPVRNQGRNDVCWTFSLTGALEATVRKSLMDAGETPDANFPDFSETHLIYATYNGGNHINPENGWERPAGNAGTGGGNRFQASSYYMRGNDFCGVVFEDEDPYDAVPNLPTTRSAETTAGKEKAYTVQNILFVTGSNKATDAEAAAIKRQIMAHGAVAANMKWQGVAVSTNGALDDTGCYNAEHAAFYSSATDLPNLAGHGVVIVGWDDDFPVDSFNENMRPTKPGAWLIKNSWDETTSLKNGLSGYFWISYEDANFPVAVTCFDGATPYDPDIKVYETDQRAAATVTLGSGAAKTVARVFRAEEDCQLTSVRVWVGSPELELNVDCIPDFKGMDTVAATVNGSPGNAYRFKEYDGFSPKNSEPFHIKYAGWYTIPLDEPVVLNAGKDFAIILSMEYAGSGGSTTFMMGTAHTDSVGDSSSTYYSIPSVAGDDIDTSTAWLGSGSQTGLDKALNFSIKAVTARHTHSLSMVGQVDPACTEAGTKAYWSCSGCGRLFADKNGETELAAPVVIPALGHDWSGWSVMKAATANSKGIECRYCNRCDAVETRDIPALDSFTVTWVDEDGTELEKDENVPYGTAPTYDGDKPAKKADDEYTYEFDKWTPDVAPVTGDATYTATYRAISSVPLKLVGSYDKTTKTATVAVVAVKPITLSNYDVTLNWDGALFTLSDVTNGQGALMSNFIPATATGKIAAATNGNNVTIDADETLASYVLTTDTVLASGDYPFTLTVTDASDEVGEALAWKGQSVDGVLTVSRLSAESFDCRASDAFTLDYTAPAAGDFTVASDQPCIVLYSNGNGYRKLEAVRAGDDTYSFTLPADYSERKKIIIAVKGDINSDGDINSTDALQVLRCSAGLRSFDEVTLLICDINGDSKLTSTDALQLLRVSAELRTLAW